MDSEHQDEKRGGTYVYDALVSAGVELLVGLPGTQTLPIDRTVVERDEMQYVMARHETAIPHIAWGYFEASGTPAATVTVPGPGDTNTMHGLKNALEDNVPILHVSPDSTPEDRGKKQIHELEPDTFDNVVKANVNVQRPIELPEKLAHGIEVALTPPFGPVRLGVPSSILGSRFTAPRAEITAEKITYDNGTAYVQAVDELAAATKPVVYAGGGARRSPDGATVVRELAAELDAPVLTSYKGKGVFPEDDPQWLGVTGSHLPPGAVRVLEAADVVLALGTDFDGVTTAHWELPMGKTLIHVNLDVDDIDVSYQSSISIVDDVTAAGETLLDELRDRPSPERWNGGKVATAIRNEYTDYLEERGLLADTAPTKTPHLLRTLRQAIPREATVAIDVGGFRLWSMQTFPVYSPDQCITAGSWAGMGVGLPAAIGAQLAVPDQPVVCFSGDGSLLMCLHELHTAAEQELDLTLVVFNNSDYGIISKSPQIEEYTDGHQFTWSSPSFVKLAEGFGWHGQRVDTAEAAARELDRALDREGPTLIDIQTDTNEPSAVEAVEYESTVDFEG